MCRVIIAGGRSYTFTNSDYELLNALHEKHRFTLVISGGARGADMHGEIWARLNNIPLDRHPADWAKWGKSAGFIRNDEMAKAADALVAFPGGRGTADMVRRAKEKGLLVLRE